jgi:hypothetical protein
MQPTLFSLLGIVLFVADLEAFAQSTFHLTLRLPPGEVSWISRTNESYQVQFSSSLSGGLWNKLGGLIPGNGGTNRFVIAAPGSEQQRFYLVAVNTNAFKRWPSSDQRMDTAHAYTGAALDPGTFSNIVGMPLLMELYVNRLEDLQTNTSAGGYDFNRYLGYQLINGALTDDPYPAHVTVAEASFVESYYPPFFASPRPALVPWYSAFRSYLRAANPAQPVGSYVGGAFCVDQPDADFYPKDTIDSHAVNSLGHLGFTNTYMRVVLSNQVDIAQWYVHPADTPNITNFQHALLSEAIARNTDFVFFDNMNEISYGFYPPEFLQAFITNISRVCAAFNANGYGTVFNLGKLPAWQRDLGAAGTYYEALFNAALGDNGAYVEQSFRYRDEPASTQQEFDSWRTLLKQHALVALSPSPQGYNVLSAAEWTAAMALIMREPGDSIFVVTDKDIYNATNHWKDWPAIYGPPLASPSFVQFDLNTWFALRSFAFGQVTAAHILVPETWPSTNSLPGVISLNGYHLIPGREPRRGTWDDVAQVYEVLADPGLSCNYDDGFADSFVLGKNQFGPNEYAGIIAVDVIFGHAPCP